MSQKQKKPVEVIVFNNPQKRKKTESQSSTKFVKGRKRQKLQSGPEEEQHSVFHYDKDKAKYDIRKMAIQSMKKTQKEDAMVDLLVELGAKRPKNKCLHPRDYMEQLKKKREDEKEEETKDGIFKKKKPKKQKRRDKDDLLGSVDGQKGFYKDGVQYVGPASK